MCMCGDMLNVCVLDLRTLEAISLPGCMRIKTLDQYMLVPFLKILSKPSVGLLKE